MERGTFVCNEERQEMNLEKESGMLTLIFAGDTVQYRDKIMPAGTVASSAGSFSPFQMERNPFLVFKKRDPGGHCRGLAAFLQQTAFR